MKTNSSLFSLGAFSLLLALAAGPAIAQPQGIGQGQSSGEQKAGTGSPQDAAAQVRVLTEEIKAVQQQINETKREVGQLLDDLTKLRAVRPAPPKGGSTEEKAAYNRSMSEWQYKVTAKEHEVYVAHAKLDQLEQKLKSLQKQLANLRGKTVEGMGR